MSNDLSKAISRTDQQIAAGVDWIKSSGFAAVQEFMAKVNDANQNPNWIRNMSDTELKALRRPALPAFFLAHRLTALRSPMIAT